MYDISRRRFVVGASTAAAVFGLAGPMEFMPSALAQAGGKGPKENQNPSGMQFFRFKVGDIEITQIFDGENVRPISPGFVKNASVEDVKKALKAGGLSGENLPISYTMTIAKIGDKHVMFDAGNAESRLPSAGRHLANMKAAGIDPAKISTVIVTHFHPDHIFGLMKADNSQMFPNAEIIVPAAEYDFWTDTGKTGSLPKNRQGLAKKVQSTFPKWKNIRRADAGSEIMKGIRAEASQGHTPGHASYHISSGNDQFMVLGDVTNIHQLFVRNPGWHAVFDMDANNAEATRRKLFDRVVADKLTVAGYHWGMPGCGTLAKDGNGYVFQPRA